MKESTLVNSLIKALKSSMPGAVIFKHFDISTAGIPDISLTWKGHIAWIECKIGPNQITKLQELILNRLFLVGALAYVITFWDRKQITIFCLRGRQNNTNNLHRIVDVIKYDIEHFND